MLSGTVDTFKRLTKHPERYLQTQNKVAEEIKDLLKTVYDFTKNQEDSDQNQNALPKLVIKDFDDEQIWQELELQNSAKYAKFISDIPRLLASRDRLYFQLEDEGNISKETDNMFESEDDENEGEDNLGIHNKGSCQEKERPEKSKKVSTCKIQPSVVDDQFFKLTQLEEFLDKEDRKENKKHKRKRTDTSDSNESDVSVDLFEDIPSDENEREEGGPRYNEFFDAPEDQGSQSISKKRKRDNVDVEYGDEEEEDEFLINDDDNYVDNSDPKNEKQVRFDMLPASSTDSESDTDGKKRIEDNDATRTKSTFEIRQERLKERIKSLEEKALADKSWQLKGEVAATNRPQNSLLEEVLEFDMTVRPAPVMTEQTTMKLEDIIRQRIKDKSWDDVERKVKPTMAPDEYKKQLVMDQEKSKLSLADIYEQEYLKQKDAQNPTVDEKPEEESQEHRTIRSMTAALFAKLDALTNFHYTPKPVIPEVKIVSNIPAITMEEVAPVGTSDATLLAPEEVKAKERGDVYGKEERTKTDKKRERRKKKQLQSKQEKEKERREKIVQKLNPGLGNKYSKERVMDTLKKVTKDRNVQQLEDEGKDKGIRSSTAFFSRLQEEVAGHIKGKLDEPKKKEKEKISAKKIKL
ncbi:hypothetical protein R5R35_000693 [Gryllus longicercus]|uniref:U3 small nucleolar ribonucleoprotein protein MPP10 n=1 Tax=Gryllus longicercus TaxID=2509291 RepID=A0AAN9VQA1_9ORTH